MKYPVSATNATDYDRNYAVEIINEKSTAIRGYHFDFVDGTNNITIKAGERVGIVKLKPTYANVAREDSLVISLRLLEPKDEELDLYGNVTRVDMQNAILSVWIISCIRALTHICSLLSRSVTNCSRYV